MTQIDLQMVLASLWPLYHVYRVSVGFFIKISRAKASGVTGNLEAQSIYGGIQGLAR